MLAMTRTMLFNYEVSASLDLRLCELAWSMYNNLYDIPADAPVHVAKYRLSRQCNKSHRYIPANTHNKSSYLLIPINRKCPTFVRAKPRTQTFNQAPLSSRAKPSGCQMLTAEVVMHKHFAFAQYKLRRELRNFCLC